MSGASSTSSKRPPSFVVIEEVLLEQGADDTADLGLTLGISTYYFVGNDGA